MTATAGLEADAVAEIRNAIGNHVQAQDAGEADRIVALYAPDAVLALPGTEPLQGHDAIRAAFVGWAPTQPQKHIVGNTVVLLVSDTEATAVSDVVFFQRDDSGWAPQVTGRYDDTLRKHDGQWLFAHRSVHYTP